MGFLCSHPVIITGTDRINKAKYIFIDIAILFAMAETLISRFYRIFTDDPGVAPIVGTLMMIGIVIVMGAVIGYHALSIETPDDHYERFREITEQNLAPADLPDGLVARWSFDGTFSDSSGNGNDGTGVGGVTFTPGIMGDAIVLNGNNYVEVPSSPSLNITNGITLVSHVRWTIDPEDGDKWANIICKLSNGGEPQTRTSYRLQHSCWGLDNNIFEFAIQTDGYTYLPTRPGLWRKKLVEQNRWYQVVATYNGSEMILYINGEKEYTRSVSGELRPSDQQPLYIGCADPDSSRNARHFTGYIDEVQIYNRALSETEVKSLS